MVIRWVDSGWYGGWYGQNQAQAKNTVEPKADHDRWQERDQCHNDLEALGGKEEKKEEQKGESVMASDRKRTDQQPISMGARVEHVIRRAWDRTELREL